MHHPCRSCGACCAQLRVSFEEQELVSRGGGVPDDLTVPYEPGEPAMKGTVGVRPLRCAALEGEIGQWTGCTIYPHRPTGCRVFNPSWENGLRCPGCDVAREAHGLPLLTPEVWEQHRREQRPTPVEAPTRLSRSVIWEMQRTFFTLKGPEAWRRDIVPFSVSTNARVAASYAHLITGFIRDCPGGAKGPLDPTQPLYIIELGSGSGRLAYLLARALQRLGTAMPVEAQVRVVATDFTDANLDWIEAHEAMQPLIEAGLVDFARYDTEAPAALELRRTGARLEPGAVRNPLVVVANYVFDGVPTDAFQVRNGALHEVLIGVGRTEDRRLDPSRLERYELVSEEREVVGEPYTDPLLNSILEEYRLNLHRAGVWFPVGAIAALRHLATLSPRPMMLLVGDKCSRSIEELEGRTVRTVAKHGSISLTVNAHAIERVVQDMGGFALHATSPDTTYTTSSFVLPGRREAFKETDLAFRTAIDDFGPREVHALTWALRSATPSATACLQLIWASACDTWTFRAYFPTVIDALASEDSPELRRQVRRVLERVAENDFWLGAKGELLALQMGRGYQALGLLDRAAWWYQTSLKRDGSRAGTWFNLGRCLEESDPERALQAYRNAVAIDPHLEEARDRLEVLGAGT
ncbi:MAG: SAM-dependent methyltransferase [Deltaproteobacteria bacterium]|nr:SAM-dependent methyltransferase [Deltaproteobacteria bacterium]